MRRTNSSAKGIDNFYTIDYRPKKTLEVKEIINSHESGVSGYSNRHLFTTKLIEYVYPQFKKEIDKIDFKGLSLTEIDNVVRATISKYHGKDIEISFSMPEPIDKLFVTAELNYTGSQCYLQHVLPILIQENFSPYILNAFHYIKHELDIPVVEYKEQVLNFYIEMPPEKWDEQPEEDYQRYKQQYLYNIYQWRFGLVAKFIQAINLEPTISVKECYKKINNKTIKGLMALLMEGYTFVDISNYRDYEQDERPVNVSEYLGFLWDWTDDCDITKMHCKHTDEYIGNDGFDDIKETFFLSENALKEKIEPNKQLIKLLKLMSCQDY